MTIVGCVNGIGQASPPMVIFDAHNLNPTWTKGEFLRTKLGLSNRGQINTELSELSLQYAVSAHPCSCC